MLGDQGDRMFQRREYLVVGFVVDVESGIKLNIVTTIAAIAVKLVGPDVDPYLAADDVGS